MVIQGNQSCNNRAVTLLTFFGIYGPYTFNISVAHPTEKKKVKLKMKKMKLSSTRHIFCIFLYGPWSPAALGNFFLICRPNSGGALLRRYKHSYITPTVTAEIETNSRKQESLLVFDSRHNSPARGFGLSVRVEKSLGHALGVLDVVRHQSMLFVGGEWAAGVIDIRQAAVISSGGIGI